MFAFFFCPDPQYTTPATTTTTKTATTTTTTTVLPTTSSTQPTFLSTMLTTKSTAIPTNKPPTATTEPPCKNRNMTVYVLSDNGTAEVEITSNVRTRLSIGSHVVYAGSCAVHIEVAKKGEVHLT